MKIDSINKEFQTPVLLNVFNRPYETNRVLEVLAAQKIPILYVHCDGAREGNINDKSNVEQVKQLINQKVTWDCEVHTMYEDFNYGCGLGPYRAISWFFENVEEGIIIEDDCIPHPDFFMYCQELLELYRTDEKIATIGGTNRHPLRKKHKSSYYFSAYSEIWGWATWRRAWKQYDYDFMVSDKDFFYKMYPFVKSIGATKHWVNILRMVRIDTLRKNKTYWDYQMDLNFLYLNKRHIIPSVNLVSNIGFNENATHTISSQSQYANTKIFPILPLIHPKRISIKYADNNEYNMFLKKIKSIIKSII